MFRLGFDCSQDGVYGLSEEESLEERKASILIKLRKYKLVKKEKLKDKVSYLVKTRRDRQKAIIWCIPEGGTVGILITNRMHKAMKEAKVEKGIIITSGRYTHAAKLNAKKKEIELVPRTFPSFDIFKHELVPKQEILTPKERKQLLIQYRIEPYQLPQIKTSDPTVKAIGAKRGDILRVIRKSTTAGTHIAYRYVVE
jgi:DNA-directed RNA polymerase subunit H